MMDNPFENMTHEQAREGGLWEYLSVNVTQRDDGQTQIDVKLTGLFSVVVPTTVIRENGGKPGIPTLVRQRLELDLQELAKVSEHKIADELDV